MQQAKFADTKPMPPPLTMQQRAELHSMRGWQTKPRNKIPTVNVEDEEAQMFDYGKKHDPEESWRRLTLRTSRVISLAREHQVQQEIYSLYVHRALPVPESEVDEDYVQVQDSQCKKHKQTVVTRMEILVRPPRQDCQGKSHLKQCKYANPNLCQHPSFMGRGNMHQCWWLCVSCPDRWPRTDVMEQLVQTE